MIPPAKHTEGLEMQKGNRMTQKWTAAYLAARTLALLAVLHCANLWRQRTPVCSTCLN
jgi:hypothetical protein